MKKPMHYLVLWMLMMSSGLQAQNNPSSFTGVWKYEWEGWEGIAIISPTHFIWLLTGANRPTSVSTPPSATEKVKIYNEILVSAGSYEFLSANRVKATRRFSINPEDLKSPLIWDFDRSGHMLTSWIIQADGSRGDAIRCRKLADWGGSSEIASLQGVWEYTGQNGIYLQAGNYGAWIILNGTLADPATDQGKAQNIDAMNASVVIGTQLSDRHYIWNIIHSVYPHWEKEALFTGFEMTDADSFQMWTEDGAGNKNGPGWKVQRIKH